MIDNIVSFLIYIPAFFGVGMFLITIIGTMLGFLYYILYNSDSFFGVIYGLVQVDTPAFNSSFMISTVLYSSLFLHVMDFVSETTVYMIFGMYSIVNLWYAIYLIDVWKEAYHDYRVKKDAELLKGNTK